MIKKKRTYDPYDHFVILLIGLNIWMFTNWKWGVGSILIMFILERYT
jgi:hypothetical protein